MTLDHGTRHTPEADAERTLAAYTLLAAGTGAIPLPAASAAIVAEDAVLVTHLSAIYGVRVTLTSVVTAIGTITMLNMAGKQLFIEVGRLLSWGSGNPWAAVALSGVGATTAGVQTYLIGRVAIAIARNGGSPIPHAIVGTVVEDARASYDEFAAAWAERKKNRR